MTGSTLSFSLVINAPVERVWSVLLEKQKSNSEIAMKEQKHLQRDPPGLPVAGQTITMKVGPLHSTTYIDKIEQDDPPDEGQTIYARMRLFGKDGESVDRWFRDSEHYHIYTQVDAKHPWVTMTEETNTRCIAIDTASCVIVYSKQYDMSVRLVPRWLKRRFENDNRLEKECVEVYFQRIKEKAEQA